MGDATHDNEQGGFRLIEIIAPKYSGTKRVWRLLVVFVNTISLFMLKPPSVVQKILIIFQCDYTMQSANFSIPVSIQMCNFSMNAVLFRRFACRLAAFLAVWGRQRRSLQNPRIWRAELLTKMPPTHFWCGSVALFCLQVAFLAGVITLRNQIISAPGISLLILITYLLDWRATK